MSFKQKETEDQRLVVLRSLIDFGYSANESIIQDFLEMFGHTVSRDKVRGHFAWLSEQGLITYEDVLGCYVAKLTARGQDVAEGRASVPGVKKPRAGE